MVQFRLNRKTPQWRPGISVRMWKFVFEWIFPLVAAFVLVWSFGAMQRREADKNTAVVKENLSTFDRIYLVGNYSEQQRVNQGNEALLKVLNGTVMRVDPIEAGPEFLDSGEICQGIKNNDRIRCRALASRVMTSMAILNDRHSLGRKEGTDMILIVESDANIKDARLLEASLEHVPSDFDVVRWGCTGEKPAQFKYVKDHVFRTACVDKKGREVQCSRWYCGGSAITLVRGRSWKKVYDLWRERPYNDVDCRLNTARLNSYCVDEGIFEKLRVE